MNKASIIAEMNYIQAKFNNGAKVHLFANIVSVIFAELSFANKDTGEIPDSRYNKIRTQIVELEKLIDNGGM
ncbi:MAG: hypothetical protein GX163_11405 [Bacteroidetes bacterium]|jgi:hypothetical protein|nr:hypothetical protein [Bacteroidota bacterium]